MASFATSSQPGLVVYIIGVGWGKKKKLSKLVPRNLGHSTLVPTMFTKGSLAMSSIIFGRNPIQFYRGHCIL
jgi:hypothetical protein